MIVRSRRTQLASSRARTHPRLWTLWLATSTGIPVAHSSEDAFAVVGERRNRVASLERDNNEIGRALRRRRPLSKR